MTGPVTLHPQAAAAWGVAGGDGLAATCPTRSPLQTAQQPPHLVLPRHLYKCRKRTRALTLVKKTHACTRTPLAQKTTGSVWVSVAYRVAALPHQE